MVDGDMYERRKKDRSIALAEVVSSFDILRYDRPGKSGLLVRPSKREIEDTFGTKNEEELVEFMLERGVPHGKRRAL